jgi:hypothetical protein
VNKILEVLKISKLVGLEDVLVSRPKARQMYEIALSQIGQLVSDDVVYCDFLGITACSSSFADEFILNIQKLVLLTENTLLIIKNVVPDVLYDINAALRLRNEKDSLKLLLLSYNNKVYAVEGDKLEPNLREVFLVLRLSEQFTARDIAQRFNIEINSASNRLKKLHVLHLVLKRDINTESGLRHAYYLP